MIFQLLQKQKIQHGLLAFLTVLTLGYQDSRANTPAATPDPSLSPKDQADRYAQDAALLMNPLTLPAALPLAEKALELNPENKKAQLIVALLRPLSIFKGFLARTEGLHESLSYPSRSAYRNLRQSLKNNSLFELYFAQSSDAPIRNELELQALLDNYKAELIRSKNELDTLLNLELSFEVLLPVQGTAIEAIWKECSYSMTNNDHITISPCNLMQRQMMHLNRGDMQTLSIMLGGQLVQTILATGYELGGALTIEQKQYLFKTPESIFEFLRTEANFGYKRGSGWQEISNLGADLLAAIRWTLNHQTLFCSTTSSSSYLHPRNVLKSNLCLNSKRSTLEQSLGFFALALAGSNLQTTIHSKGLFFNDLNQKNSSHQYSEHATSLRPEALINHGPSHLKALFPQSYDGCGNIHQFADNSLSGLLPNSDADQIAQRWSRPCLP